MSKPILSAQVFLNKCDYISQDGDTVYIDEDALINCLESYGAYCTTVANNQNTSEYYDNFIEDEDGPCEDNP